MKKTILIATALWAAPAAAQEPAQPAPVAAIIQTQTDGILRAGVEVPLIMREELTTKKKKLRVGQRFQMEVSANVTNGGTVVIPAGTPAIGEVTEIRNKGMWGKSGYIGARIVSLRLGDRHVRLSGTFDDKGVTGTAGVIGAIAVIPIAGFFTTGTSASIANGSAVKAFLDEDIAYRAPVSAPAIQLPAPAAAVAPAVVPATQTSGGLITEPMKPAAY